MKGKEWKEVGRDFGRETGREIGKGCTGRGKER